MTNSNAQNDSCSMTAKVTELKKELQDAVICIVQDDEFNEEIVDQMQMILRSLKQMRMRKKSFSLRLNETVNCPEEFKCPLSKELMTDPVVLSTGLTFDRPFVQRWLKEGNRTCPVSQQVLSHTLLTPNCLVRDIISQWCKNQGVECPDPVDLSNKEAVTRADRDLFLGLLDKMSAAVPEQKQAAKELRRLTKRLPSFRALFGECADAIPQLLAPLSPNQNENSDHPDLQEDVITTILNLSIHDNNKKLVAETPMVVPLLLESLRSGTVDTKANAAAALFTLSALDSNKLLIGKADALIPLVDLLEEGHPHAMKDAASAIFSLCICHENKARAVKAGAVKVMARKIMAGISVGELLATLAILSTHPRAIEEMADLGMVPRLFQILQESSCERSKENCIAILHTICLSDRTSLKAMREEEHAHGTISRLAREGTSRARRKAMGILERLNRLASLTNTA